MVEKGKWYGITEAVRVYHYPNNRTVVINSVSGLLVSNGGNHYIRTTEGKQYIMAPGWEYIHFKADDFTIPTGGKE